MSIKPSKTGYFLSLGEELTAQALRVRQLIGSAHWGQDGRHKETLLANLIRRHSPSNVLVSAGFVVSPNNTEVRSKEQDILLIDTAKEAPLFNQGDLAIVFPHTVLAAISVKSKLEDSTVESVVVGLRSVREVARDAGLEPGVIWCAGFFYAVHNPWFSNPGGIYRSLAKHIRANPARSAILDSGKPHSLGPDLLSDHKDMSLLCDYTRTGDVSAAAIRGYQCNGAATAVFISCMLEHIALRLTDSRSMFSDYLSELNIQQLNPASAAL
jgi:hypothetical protein